MIGAAAALMAGGEAGRKKTARPVVCLVVGHEPTKPGASNTDGVTEFAWNTRLVDYVASYLAGAGKVSVRRLWRADVGYTRLPDAINKTDALLTVEYHFNSSDDPAANGTEMLHWPTSAKGKVLAGILLDAAVRALGTRDRGMKATGTGARGGYLLGHTRMPCVIAESYFGSNEADTRKANASFEGLALAYARAIERAAMAI